MLETILKGFETPLILILTITYLFCSSITTFGVRITQAKRNGTWNKNEPDLPNWTNIFYFLEWGLIIYIVILNWRFAIALMFFKFILKVLPVLEIIGNILMRPFKK